MPEVLRGASARHDSFGQQRRDGLQPQTGRFEVHASSRHHIMILHRRTAAESDPAVIPSLPYYSGSGFASDTAAPDRQRTRLGLLSPGRRLTALSVTLEPVQSMGNRVLPWGSGFLMRV